MSSVLIHIRVSILASGIRTCYDPEVRGNSPETAEEPRDAAPHRAGSGMLPRSENPFAKVFFDACPDSIRR